MPTDQSIIPQTRTPQIRRMSREQLGVQPDVPLILFVTSKLSESPQECESHDWLSQITQELGTKYNFLTIAAQERTQPGGTIPIIGRDDTLTAYSAADILVCTSTEESSTDVIFEAQALGIPVIAFNTTRACAIIRNNITGKIIRNGAVSDMISAIRELISDAHVLYHSGAWARQSAASRFPNINHQNIEATLAASLLASHRPRPPEIAYPLGAADHHLPHRPSWPVDASHISNEHASIFEQTANIPGWQMRGDSEKLYELGYYSGDVILEIGTYGGRSATVELRGALANKLKTHKPQFYGIDISPDSIARTRQSLADQQLIDYCHLFLGTLEDFYREWHIEPTMVFLDGDHSYEGAFADMQNLSKRLKEGTPVLVHDYLDTENDTGQIGVRRATDEWISSKKVKFFGCFGCSALVMISS